MTNIVNEMERRYHCRYEAGNGVTFPVTHVIDGAAGSARYACITINNGEVLNYMICDAFGAVLVHGSEQNHARTRLGYVRMIRRALRHVRAYGVTRRVYPRDAANRKAPARPALRWDANRWPGSF